MHRIVIVGGGAGGLELATRLGNRSGKAGRAQVTLVDRCAVHVWKPLLHEVAAGSLDTMKFGSEGSSKSKAWKDIWGSGQGIGAIDRVRPAAGYIDLLAEQYAAAKARLCAC